MSVAGSGDMVYQQEVAALRSQYSRYFRNAIALMVALGLLASFFLLRFVTPADSTVDDRTFAVLQYSRFLLAFNSSRVAFLWAEGSQEKDCSSKIFLLPLNSDATSSYSPIDLTPYLFSSFPTTTCFSLESAVVSSEEQHTDGDRDSALVVVRGAHPARVLFRLTLSRASTVEVPIDYVFVPLGSLQVQIAGEFVGQPHNALMAYIPQSKTAVVILSDEECRERRTPLFYFLLPAEQMVGNFSFFKGEASRCSPVLQFSGTFAGEAVMYVGQSSTEQDTPHATADDNGGLRYDELPGPSCDPFTNYTFSLCSIGVGGLIACRKPSWGETGYTVQYQDVSGDFLLRSTSTCACHWWRNGSLAELDAADTWVPQMCDVGRVRVLHPENNAVRYLVPGPSTSLSDRFIVQTVSHSDSFMEKSAVAVYAVNMGQRSEVIVYVVDWVNIYLAVGEGGRAVRIRQVPQMQVS